MGEEFLRHETEAKTVNGWIALLIVSALLAFGGFFLVSAPPHLDPPLLTAGLALIAVASFCLRGFLTLQPNQAAVMVFFGSYAGTARTSGFHWVNPFYLKRRLSLRAHNLTTPVLKVNDERGNPIEIGAVGGPIFSFFAGAVAKPTKLGVSTTPARRPIWHSRSIA